jgi:hypothetical protein
MVVTVTLAAGRSTEAKQAFCAELCRALVRAVGLRPEDLAELARYQAPDQAQTSRFVGSSRRKALRWTSCDSGCRRVKVSSVQAAAHRARTNVDLVLDLRGGAINSAQ